MTRKFNIQALLDHGIQTRVQIDAALVTKYAELMRDGTVFPPVSVVSDGKADWLVDGFHRAKAALECGADEIEAEVTEGTKTDALKAALLANAKHGTPRNENDVQKVLDLAWIHLGDFIKPVDYHGQDPVTGRPNGFPSARQFASITGVSKSVCANFLNVIQVSARTPPSKEKSETATTHEHIEHRNPKVRENLKNGLDRFGQAIPENLLGALRSRLVGKFRKQLANGRKALVRCAQKPEFAWLDVPHVAKQIEAVEKLLRECEPYCVCPDCQGLGCGSCKQRGFMGQFAFNLLPSSTKKALKAAGMGA